MRALFLIIAASASFAIAPVAASAADAPLIIPRYSEAEIDTILPLALLRDRATTDLILSGLDASGVAFALFSPDDDLAYGSSAFRLLFDVEPGGAAAVDHRVVAIGSQSHDVPLAVSDGVAE